MSTQEPLRPMHLSLRFIAPLAVTLALLAYRLVPLVDRLDPALVGQRPRHALATDRQYACRISSPSWSSRGRRPRSTGFSCGRSRTSGCTRSPTATTPARCAIDARPIRRRSGAVLRTRGGEGHSVVRLRQGPLHVVQHPVFQGNERIGIADPRARHELRRAAQRRHPALPDRHVRRAWRRDLAGHRFHRASFVARLGQRGARAAARRRHRAAVFEPGVGAMCIRWRATCARCCAIWT